MEETNSDIQEIKGLLKTDKVVMGTEKTIKEIKANSIGKVFLSSNVSEDVEKDINYYSGMTDTKVIKLTVPNDELGVLCQKPFFISVLGVRK